MSSSPHWKSRNEQKQSENAEKGNPKKNVEENELKRNPEKKKGWNEKWRETRKEDQSRNDPSLDKKWSLVWSP